MRGADPDFSRYGDTDRQQIDIYSNGHSWFTGLQAGVFSLIVFRDEGTANLIFANTDGKVEELVDHIGYAVQGSRQNQFSPATLNEVMHLLRSLPKRNSYPPIGQLVVVAYTSPHGWIKHCYDSSHLPPPLKKIYGLIAPEIRPETDLNPIPSH